VAEADESGDAVPAAEPAVAAAASTAPSPMVQPDAIRRLFSQLTIRPREDGGVHIDAPPEAAAGLAALFEGMASLLRQSSTPS